MSSSESAADQSPDALDVDPNPTIQAAATRFYRSSYVLLAVATLAWAVLFLVLRSLAPASPLGELASWGAFTVLVAAFLIVRVDLHATTVLETDASPEAALDDVSGILAPHTAIGMAWADAVVRLDDPSATTAVRVDGSFLGVLDASYEYRARRPEPGVVAFAFGDGTNSEATGRIAVEPAGGGSRVTIAATAPKKNLVGVANRALQGRYQRRVLDSLGYRVVDTDGRRALTTVFS